MLRCSFVLEVWDILCELELSLIHLWKDVVLLKYYTWRGFKTHSAQKQYQIVPRKVEEGEGKTKNKKEK